MLEMRLIDVLNNLKGHDLWPQSYHLTESEAKTCIKALEEVLKSEPKTGHWIHFASGDDCSECGWSTGKYISPSKYCPDCGAKMQEVEE